MCQGDPEQCLWEVMGGHRLGGVMFPFADRAGLFPSPLWQCDRGGNANWGQMLSFSATKPAPLALGLCVQEHPRGELQFPQGAPLGSWAVVVGLTGSSLRCSAGCGLTLIKLSLQTLHL